MVNEFEIIQKAFFWNNSSPKIKHETLSSDYKAVGSKINDIPNKIIALQCFWIRKLHDNSFHEWNLNEKSFGTSFKFHSNLFFKSNKSFFHFSIGKLF